MITTPTAIGKLRVVRCAIGAETYAIDLSRVQTIQRADRMCPADGDLLAGTLPLRGEEVPVFRLAALLQRRCPPSAGTPHVVVVEVGARRWGLLVDHVSQSQPISAEHVQSLPPLAGLRIGDLVQRVVQVGEETMLLLAAELLHPDTARPQTVGLERWADENASASEAPATRSGRGTARQILLFATADAARRQRPLLFGVGLGAVRELLELPTLVPCPLAAPFVLGLASCRGRPVLVLDLARRLGLPPSVPDRRSRLLIVRAAEGRVAFLVRPNVRVHRLPLAHGVPDRELSLDPALVRGVVELEAETLAVLTLRGLLAAPSTSPTREQGSWL